MKKISIKQYIGIFFILLFIFSGLGLTSTVLYSDVEKIPIIIKPQKEECTLENVKKVITELHIQHPEIVYAQVCIESNNLKSTIYKENNNLIGMKVATTRPTTSSGENKGHSTYNNYYECLVDLALWQSCYARNLSDAEYLQVLKTMYAEDPFYSTKIKNLINRKTNNIIY